MYKESTTHAFRLNNQRATLLVVDDQPTNIRLIHSILVTDYEIFMATTGQKALEICDNRIFDLILLDVMMPEMSGLELCKILKKQANTKEIPVIFITSSQSLDEETACWGAGCVDFINKPFNPTTLRNRVKVHLTLKFQNEYLRQLALIDGLTGIPNRRCFEEQLKLEFQRAKRTNTSLALLMIDVDYFKQYNDQYGHQAGDDCLRKIAEVLKKTMLRAGDLIARYGGEEFVCILPDTESKGAAAIANKLLAEIQKLHIDNALSEVMPMITISIGFAVYSSNNIDSPEGLITAADIQLYSAKNNGRNIVYPLLHNTTR